MKKLWALSAVLVVAATASAVPLLDDGFDQGPWSITPFSNPNYTSHYSNLGQSFLGNRYVAAADNGNPKSNAFVVSEGSSQLSAAGTGDGPVMQIAYTSQGGATDLTIAPSITLYVHSNPTAETVDLGAYSDGYGSYAASSFVLPAGFSGTRTILFSSLVAQDPSNHPLDLASVDSLNVTFHVPSGSSVVLDRLTINPVPEPASVAALGLGVAGLIRHGRNNRRR